MYESILCSSSKPIVHDIPENYWLGKTLLRDRLPWLTPGAIHFLDKRAGQESHVLEFGAGGSTLYFADRCKSVLTWEPNPDWKSKILNLLGRSRHRCTITSNLNRALESQIHWYDIILIDCEDQKAQRPVLCKKVAHRVKHGGVLILDNYSRYAVPFGPEWRVARHNDPHWHGSGTLIAIKK